MSYSYATAKTVLSDIDKDRILAMHLSSDTNDVDWDKATQAYGAASVESMRVSYRNLLKKIEKAGGKTGVTAPFTGADGSAPSTPKTPRTPKTPKGKGGRPPKRKAENTGSEEDDDGDAPKTLRMKAAKNIIKAQDEDEDEDTPKSINKKVTKTNARAEDDDEDDEETTKTSKKTSRSRKTPVKSIEPAQEDEETSQMVKEEDESEC